MKNAQNIVYGILLLLIVGAIGAFPITLMAWILSSGAVAQDIFLLVTITLGSWLPIKLLVDGYVKEQSNFKIPQLSPAVLTIALFSSILLVPILYGLTFTSLVFGTLAYVFSGNSLLFGLIIALGVQIANSYRASLREKAMGVNNSAFVHFQTINASNFDVMMTSETMQRQAPRADESPILYLPEEDDDFGQRIAEQHADEPMTITLDPDTDNQSQSDS